MGDSEGYKYFFTPDKPAYAIAISKAGPIGENITSTDPNIGFVRLARGMGTGDEQGVVLFTEREYADQFAKTLPAGLHTALVPLESRVAIKQFLQYEQSCGTRILIFDVNSAQQQFPPHTCLLAEAIDEIEKLPGAG